MNERIRLVVLSFVMLFVELGVIRWLGSNVIYLSFFANLVLMGSFLGIGLGFLKARARTDLFGWSILALAFLIAFVLLFPVSIERPQGDVFYFGTLSGGIPIWVVLPVVFLAVCGLLMTIAQAVARTFSQFESLEAYRLDIIGSLAGIVAFALLSFLGAPPVVWGAIVCAVLLVLYRPSIRLAQVAAALAVVLMLGKESLTPGFLWSPYYKIHVFSIKPGTLVYDLNGAPFRVRGQVVAIDVNGINHQTIVPTTERRSIEPIYFIPYRRLQAKPNRVLIVGAGNGKDVAIALVAGARHVDAVEIDPRIRQIGRALNPDRPYESPKVTSYIDDGRAFLGRTHGQYDLILFALPDSLALISGQSSLRLESYLFTLESMQAARAHLTPRGAFGMYNYYRERWLVDRLAGTLQTAFGRAPCIDGDGSARRLALLIVGGQKDNVKCDVVWHPVTPAVSQAVTDDRPFPYLRTPSIPKIYLITIGLILLVSLVMIRFAGGGFGTMTGYADLFFMGAAFLLLETKSVVQFALLFGTTWLVNALVFFGILLAVLVAIEVARCMRVNEPQLLYGALLVTLALAWAIEPERLLALSLPLRLPCAIALAFGPVFMANLIFAQRFKEVASSTAAFAANLLGAMAGGVTEYVSLVIGYRNLLLVVAAFYVIALVLDTRRRRVSAKGSATSIAPSTSP